MSNSNGDTLHPNLKFMSEQLKAVVLHNIAATEVFRALNIKLSNFERDAVVEGLVKEITCNKQNQARSGSQEIFKYERCAFQLLYTGEHSEKIDIYDKAIDALAIDHQICKMIYSKIILEYTAKQAL